MKEINIYIQSVDYSFSQKQWEDIREAFPLTYEKCHDSIYDDTKANQNLLFKKGCYFSKTSKGIEIIDSFSTVEILCKINKDLVEIAGTYGKSTSNIFVEEDTTASIHIIF